jgi:glucose-1-phosphate thymidylyltransferase
MGMSFFYSKTMKGIVLAGGKGTRLLPITTTHVKQLLPVYDKPMIYYPISILMLSGIKDIMIITNPEDVHSMKKLLGDGSELGCRFEYEVQTEARGIADAFIIAEDFIGDDAVCLILGDNIFYSSGLAGMLKAKKMEWDGFRGISPATGACIFAYHVSDPERYGVVEFDEKNRVISIEEKPKKPKSSFAIPGLYFYDNKVVKMAKNLKPSDRGELEITDINQIYLKKNQLHVAQLQRGTAWLDTGTFESLMEAGQFIHMVEKRQGQKVGCIEEIAYKMGWIDKNQLKSIAKKYEKSGYGEYLTSIAENEPLHIHGTY